MESPGSPGHPGGEKDPFGLDLCASPELGVRGPDPECFSMEHSPTASPPRPLLGSLSSKDSRVKKPHNLLGALIPCWRDLVFKWRKRWRMFTDVCEAALIRSSGRSPVGEAVPHLPGGAGTWWALLMKALEHRVRRDLGDTAHCEVLFEGSLLIYPK